MIATLIVIAVGVWLHLLLVVLAIGRATTFAVKLREGLQQWATEQQGVAEQQQPDGQVLDFKPPESAP